MTTELNPLDFIDRKAEQELFGTLVAFESSARMLTVCDGGGRGKSSLLRRLQYNCQHEIKPAIPACRIELDRLSDPSPFVLVSRLTSQESGFKLRGEDVSKRFAKFNQLDEARTAKDFTPFDDGSASRSWDPRVVASASASAVHEGGINAGIYAEQAQFLPRQFEEFTDEQEQRARQRCVEAFFDDLRTICAMQPMALVFDGWEGCNLSLREWIRDEMLGNHVLHPDPNLRPERLAVVIAGRPHQPPDTSHGLRADEFRALFDSEEEHSATVLSIKSLSDWESEHVSEFMVLNGCPQPTEAQVNLIQEQLRKGVSLEKILSLIDEHLRPTAGL